MIPQAILMFGLLLSLLAPGGGAATPPEPDAAALLEQGDVFEWVQHGTPEESVILELPTEAFGTVIYQIQPATGEILARYAVEGTPLSDGTRRQPRLRRVGDGYRCGGDSFLLRDGVLARLPLDADALEIDAILDLVQDGAGGVYLLAATEPGSQAVLPPVGNEVLYLTADGAVQTVLSRQYRLDLTDLSWQEGQLYLRYEGYPGKQGAAWAVTREYLLEPSGASPSIRVVHMGFPDDVYWSFSSDEAFRAYVQSQVEAEQQRLNDLGIGVTSPEPEVPADAQVVYRYQEGTAAESVIYQWVVGPVTEIRQMEPQSGRVLAKFTVPCWQQPNLSAPFARTLDHASDAGCWGTAGFYRFQDGLLTCATDRPLVKVLPLDDGGAYLLSYTDDYIPVAEATVEFGNYGNEVLHLWPDGSVTTALPGTPHLEFSDLAMQDGTLLLIDSFGREIDPYVKRYLLEREGAQPQLRVYSIRATDNEYAAHLDDPEGFQASLQAAEQQRLNDLGIGVP